MIDLACQLLGSTALLACGYVIGMTIHMGVDKPCDHCSGTGKITKESETCYTVFTCPACRGNKTVRQ